MQTEDRVSDAVQDLLEKLVKLPSFSSYSRREIEEHLKHCFNYGWLELGHNSERPVITQNGLDLLDRERGPRGKQGAPGYGFVHE